MPDSLPNFENRTLPPAIERLGELAYNLWWSWHSEAQALYSGLDADLWQEVDGHPLALLRRIDDERLTSLALDSDYLSRYQAVLEQFDAYMQRRDTWFGATYPEVKNGTIAYFSAEFGLHESLPIYSGGLGILSGDHCKEASDLDLPFVGVGLLYRAGYFRQRIDANGSQQVTYYDLQPANLPIRPALNSDGQPVQVELDLNGLQMRSDVWQVQVGRIALYLLDTQVASNQPDVTAQMTRLYGGTRQTRLLQEALLGIGGMQALAQLGVRPQAIHLNEGHSAFATLEAARQRVARSAQSAQRAQSMSTQAALAATKAHTVFTTHTPVPAGLDTFELELIEQHLSSYWQGLGLDRESFFELAQQDLGWGEQFSMPMLALSLSTLRNGVSQLHGQVSRKLFRAVWPDLPVDEVPIGHVTNGVHVDTWLGPQMAQLFDRHLGPEWRERQDQQQIWQTITEISDEELWATRETLKAHMLRYLHQRLALYSSEEAPWSALRLAPDVLTIGFARRFAPYKRATLLLHDLPRLKHLVNSADRPLQFIFAGKAHPADEAGQALITQICKVASDSDLQGRIAFVQNYDMKVGRVLTSGVDVWLNNPRRPYEASGTSGQKAAMNGAPNLSILDGWWAEGFASENGWVIGNDEVDADEAAQDAHDAEALYDLLENEVIPLYYQRDEKGLPVEWLQVVRAAIVSSVAHFGARRMLKQYTEGYYVPLLRA